MSSILVEHSIEAAILPAEQPVTILGNTFSLNRTLITPK